MAAGRTCDQRGTWWFPTLTAQEGATNSESLAHPRHSDLVGLGQGRHQLWLKAPQVILGCRVGWRKRWRGRN